jgi:hypothetical protein
MTNNKISTYNCTHEIPWNMVCSFENNNTARVCKYVIIFHIHVQNVVIWNSVVIFNISEIYILLLPFAGVIKMWFHFTKPVGRSFSYFVLSQRLKAQRSQISVQFRSKNLKLISYNKRLVGVLTLPPPQLKSNPLPKLPLFLVAQ